MRWRGTESRVGYVREPGRGALIALLCLVAVATATASVPPTASAAVRSYERVGEFGNATSASSSEPGKFATNPMPGRIAVAEGTGYVYVADPGNRRIQVFKPEGASASFLLQVTSPNPVGLALDQTSGSLYASNPPVNERQLVELRTSEGSLGGSFSLTFEGQTTGSTGSGNLTAGSKTVNEVTGAFFAGEAIGGAGIPAGTTISSVNQGAKTLTLSQAATETATGVALSAQLGPGMSGPNLANALGLLPAIGSASNVQVGTSGTNPKTYTIEFKGALAGRNVPQVTVDGSGLTPAGKTTATASTAVDGSRGQITKFNPDNASNPTAYTPDLSFTSPVEGSGTGQIGSFGTPGPSIPSPGGIAVDPTNGDLLVADPVNRVIDRFSATGSFKSSFDGSNGATAFVKPADLAVDSDGDVIVADITTSNETQIRRYSGAGVYEATLGPVPNGIPNSTGVVVAVNLATDEALVSSKESLLAEGKIYRFEDIAPVGGEPVPPVDQITAPEERFKGNVFGLAVRGQAPGRLYALATNSFASGIPRVQVYDASTAAPPVVAVEAVDPGCVTATSACLRGTVTPEGSGTTWHFEIRPVGAPGWTVLQPGGDAGEGEAPVQVTATASGLEPNTEYEVRLTAANSLGKTTSAPPNPTFKTAAAPPDVATGRAWSISDTHVTLAGRVDPNNSAVVDCHFDYGTTPSYGETAPCAPAPGGGGSPVQVAANIVNLQPNTTYHFRLVADNGVTVAPGETQIAGEDATFETRPPIVFPKRGYELVSAADTNGVEAYPVFAAADGDAYAYGTEIPVPGSENGYQGFFRATRSPDGSWSQRFIAAPAPAAPGEPAGSSSLAPPLFSADLSVAAFGTPQGGLDPDDKNQDVDTYRRQANGAIAWISRSPAIPTGTPQTASGNAGEVVYVSADGERILFRSSRQLLAEDPAPPAASLYQWDRGALSLVSRIPASGGACDDAHGPACVGAPNASDLGSGQDFEGAVSRDGSRVVFQSQLAGRPRLYVRIDGARTLEASASAPGVIPPVTTPLDVRFWGADQDVSSVFFTSSSALTPDSGAPNAVGGARDLYRYDVDAERLTDLTPAAGGAGVTWVYDVSDDGRRVYFVASKQLTQTGGEPDGVPGGPNLYLAEFEGDQVSLRFIAAIDPQELTPAAGGANVGTQAWRAIAANPDGSVLAFRDRLPVVPGRQTGGRPQVFVYEADRDELSCASCPLDGSAPSGEANLPPSDMVPSGKMSPETVSNTRTNGFTPHARNVTPGGVVFFATSTGLVDADNNKAVDVYEYRGGEVALVSSAGPQKSIFADASADGGTVFFRSANSLVAGAQAGVEHIYAARIGGGFQPPPQTPPCTGDDCRGPLAGAAAEPSPGSLSFAGSGNPRSRAAGENGSKQGRHRSKKRRRRGQGAKHRSGRSRRSARQRGRGHAGHRGKAGSRNGGVK